MSKMRSRTGSLVIGNRTTGCTTQIEFPSKQQCCRELGCTMKRLDRIIDERIPTLYDEKEWFFDEMFTEDDTCKEADNGTANVL